MAHVDYKNEDTPHPAIAEDGLLLLKLRTMHAHPGHWLVYVADKATTGKGRGRTSLSDSLPGWGYEVRLETREVHGRVLHSYLARWPRDDDSEPQDVPPAIEGVEWRVPMDVPFSFSLAEGWR